MIVKTTLSKWFRRNWVSLSLVVLMIGMVCYHFFGTYNPPITQPVIVSPLTKNKVLDNGQKGQVKVFTPETELPGNAGFSESFVKDTVGKILGIKEKEIVAINQVKGKYQDSLQLFKTELNEQKRLTKYYQSKDRNGNVIGTAQTTDDGPLVYKGNINLITAVKKGTKKSPDSILFYDPTERVTINESKEFRFAIPEKKQNRFKIAPVIGIGVVAPVKVDNGKVKINDVGLGIFGGISVAYTFK